MKTWYLMSAYALTNKRTAPITEVLQHWEDSTVYLIRTRSGKKMYASSAGNCRDAYIGDELEMVKDTGNGYAYLSYNDRSITIENIVYTKNGEITGSELPLVPNEKRAIYVFK
jgi:hypothetical protein